MYNVRRASRLLTNFQYSETGENATTQETGISWAICLPSDCSDEDVGEIVGTILGSKSVTCQTKKDLHPPLTGGAIATM